MAGAGPDGSEARLDVRVDVTLRPDDRRGAVAAPIVADWVEPENGTQSVIKMLTSSDELSIFVSS